MDHPVLSKILLSYIGWENTVAHAQCTCSRLFVCKGLQIFPIGWCTCHLSINQKNIWEVICMHYIFPQVENGISLKYIYLKYYIIIPKGVIINCAFSLEYDRFIAYKLISYFLKKYRIYVISSCQIWFKKQ